MIEGAPLEGNTRSGHVKRAGQIPVEVKSTLRNVTELQSDQDLSWGQGEPKMTGKKKKRGKNWTEKSPLTPHCWRCGGRQGVQSHQKSTRSNTPKEMGRRHVTDGELESAVGGH